MKTFTKIAVVLLLACSTFNCKKEPAPLSAAPKSEALLSSVYGEVTTVAIGVQARALAVDAANSLYAVNSNSQIYMVTPNGAITLLAGNANPGFKDGSGAAAQFGYFMAGMTFGPDSALYVADRNNSSIRKITLCGVVTTFAGRPSAIGDQDGPVAQAKFNYPYGITLCGDGYLYVTEPYGREGNQKDIRVITPGAGGTVSTIYKAGPFAPWAIAIYRGIVYFSDQDTGTIEKIADGTLSTFAVGINTYSLAVDSFGNLYATDIPHYKIMKITPDGVVSTLAGNGGAGSADGVGTNASFNLPWGLAVHGDYLYVGDINNSSIRKIVIK